jgi:hypothetical protein
MGMACVSCESTLGHLDTHPGGLARLPDLPQVTPGQLTRLAAVRARLAACPLAASRAARGAIITVSSSRCSRGRVGLSRRSGRDR